MKIRTALLALFFSMLIVSTAFATADDGTIRSWNKEEQWQYIQFGQYMYEKNGAMAPVEWRVLYVEDGKALIITEYVIDLCQPHHMESEADYNYYKEVKHKGRLKPIMKLYEDTGIPAWFDEVMWPVLIGDDPIGNAFVDDGNAVLRLDVLPRLYEEFRRCGDLVIDIAAELADVGMGAVPKGNPHGDGAHIQFVLRNHPIGF